jgi:hypothetical protein
MNDTNTLCASDTNKESQSVVEITSLNEPAESDNSLQTSNKEQPEVCLNQNWAGRLED